MIAEARAALLVWYDANARDLPWRRTRDPYAIWVSEIMLQQTRVDTVIPYFDRFLARFPTMKSLAEATEDDVLAMWSGLGYYRRARFLHAGVRDALARYGEVPRDPVARRSLPGVGAYTAGAIGSIAFDAPEPIVDGNVARVLSRFHRLAATLADTQGSKQLWALAATWADGERPGALNQALMELGATVCTPSEPRCPACPLASLCAVRASDEADAYPPVAPKKKPTPARWSAALVKDAQGRIAVVRGTVELFGGLHGPPMVDGERDALVVALEALGAVATLTHEPAFSVKHVLSHRALTVDVYVAAAEGAGADLSWLAEADLDQVGISRLSRKILERARAGAAASPPTRSRRPGPGS